MLDYIFFHPLPAKEFKDFLEQKNIATTIKEDEETFEISLPEDIDNQLMLEIDETYDRLLDMNRDLVNEEQKNSNDDYGNASIVVNLSDGSYSYADVDPSHLNKILQVITPDEFGKIVDAIADAVEKPEEHSYCHRQKKQEE